MSVNKVILIGRLGKDPEVRKINNNATVYNFPLATREVFKNTDGTYNEQTEWHNIVMWRGLAEVAEKYVRKGNLLYIEGKIRTKSVGEEGNKKYFTDIVADQMTMLGSKNSGGNSQSNADIPRGIETAPLPDTTSAPTDDLPF